MTSRTDGLRQPTLIFMLSVLKFKSIQRRRVSFGGFTERPLQSFGVIEFPKHASLCILWSIDATKKIILCFMLPRKMIVSKRKSFFWALQRKNCGRSKGDDDTWHCFECDDKRKTKHRTITALCATYWYWNFAAKHVNTRRFLVQFVIVETKIA